MYGRHPCDRHVSGTPADTGGISLRECGKGNLLTPGECQLQRPADFPGQRPSHAERQEHPASAGLRELVVVIDFGGQYNQLVARRVRECNVYCEIYSYKTDIEKIKEMNPKGIILTGGPNSCYEADSPTYTKELFELGIPVLGLCYGAQLMQHILGGKVEKAPVREIGRASCRERV